jgi:hypothetical protein
MKNYISVVAVIQAIIEELSEDVFSVRFAPAAA